MGKSGSLVSSGLAREDLLGSSPLPDTPIFNKDDMQKRLSP